MTGIGECSFVKADVEAGKCKCVAPEVTSPEQEDYMSRLQKLGMLNREGMKACNSGRNEDALFQLIQADSIARSLKSPLHEAKVRNNIGLVHQLSGNNEEALACFRLAKRSAVAGAGTDTKLHRVIVRNLTRLESIVQGKAA